MTLFCYIQNLGANLIGYWVLHKKYNYIVLHLLICVLRCFIPSHLNETCMRKTILLITTLLLSCSFAASSSAEQIISAVRVAEPPVIDGNDNDPVWNKAEQVITPDQANDLPIAVKAIYTSQEIFILIKFKDPDESRTHKSWQWDKGLGLYRVDYDREDIFVIKWNMAPEPVDLSIYSDDSYLADVWYWKASRTDPVGYADDKIHMLYPVKDRDATELKNKAGKKVYLTRSADKGTSAFKIDMKMDYQGEKLPRYINRQPTGSRADVKAKGNWHDGGWTIEYARALDTGNRDDVQFKVHKKYLLGVSRYEIAGRSANEKLSQPLYGTGDINEVLWLHFIR